VRAAQAAFFQAAVDRSQAAPPPAAAAPAGAQAAADAPQRPLRPGSLLDIKV
jgi:hypothetical protein